MNKKNNKLVYIAAFGLLLAGLGMLIASGVSENSVYFLNVSEALAMDQGKLRQARLFGTVDGRDLDVSRNPPGASFLLQDKDNPTKTLAVAYKGAVPDTFKAGAEVIVEGGFKPEARTFQAATLMTKCPSKYEKENRE